MIKRRCKPGDIWCWMHTDSSMNITQMKHTLHTIHEPQTGDERGVEAGDFLFDREAEKVVDVVDNGNSGLTDRENKIIAGLSVQEQDEAMERAQSIAERKNNDERKAHGVRPTGTLEERGWTDSEFGMDFDQEPDGPNFGRPKPPKSAAASSWAMSNEGPQQGVNESDDDFSRRKSKDYPDDLDNWIRMVKDYAFGEHPLRDIINNAFPGDIHSGDESLYAFGEWLLKNGVYMEPEDVSFFENNRQGESWDLDSRGTDWAIDYDRVAMIEKRFDLAYDPKDLIYGMHGRPGLQGSEQEGAGKGKIYKAGKPGGTYPTADDMKKMDYDAGFYTGPLAFSPEKGYRHMNGEWNDNPNLTFDDVWTLHLGIDPIGPSVIEHAFPGAFQRVFGRRDSEVLNELVNERGGIGNLTEADIQGLSQENLGRVSNSIGEWMQQGGPDNVNMLRNMSFSQGKTVQVRAYYDYLVEHPNATFREAVEAGEESLLRGPALAEAEEAAAAAGQSYNTYARLNGLRTFDNNFANSPQHQGIWDEAEMIHRQDFPESMDITDQELDDLGALESEFTGVPQQSAASLDQELEELLENDVITEEEKAWAEENIHSLDEMPYLRARVRERGGSIDAFEDEDAKMEEVEAQEETMMEWYERDAAERELVMNEQIDMAAIGDDAVTTEAAANVSGWIQERAALEGVEVAALEGGASLAEGMAWLKWGGEVGMTVAGAYELARLYTEAFKAGMRGEEYVVNTDIMISAIWWKDGEYDPDWWKRYGARLLAGPFGDKLADDQHWDPAGEAHEPITNEMYWGLGGFTYLNDFDRWMDKNGNSWDRKYMEEHYPIPPPKSYDQMTDAEKYNLGYVYVDKHTGIGDQILHLFGNAGNIVSELIHDPNTDMTEFHDKNVKTGLSVGDHQRANPDTGWEGGTVVGHLASGIDVVDG